MNASLLPGRLHRVLLLGGTSEIGLAIISALSLPAGSLVILAGRDSARLTEAAATLAGSATTADVPLTPPPRPSTRR